jgi:hypothetical protein
LGFSKRFELHYNKAVKGGKYLHLEFPEVGNMQAQAESIVKGNFGELVGNGNFFCFNFTSK